MKEIIVTVTQEDWDKGANECQSGEVFTPGHCAVAQAVKRAIGREFVEREGVGYGRIELQDGNYRMTPELKTLVRLFDNIPYHNVEFPGEVTAVCTLMEDTNEKP